MSANSPIDRVIGVGWGVPPHASSFNLLLRKLSNLNVQQGHVDSKTLPRPRQNPPFLNCECQLMQVVLYNGHRMLVVVCCCLCLADSPKLLSQDFASSQSEVSPSVGFLLQTNDQHLDQSELSRWTCDEICDHFPSLFDSGHGILDWFDNDDLFWAVACCSRLILMMVTCSWS